MNQRTKTQIPSKSFCVLPWIHLFVSEYGEFFPCCHREPEVSALRDDEGLKINANEKNSSLKAYHSKDLKDLRAQFLRGEYPERCRQCWTLEKRNLNSSRVHFNNVYQDEIETLLESHSNQDANTLRFMDIRMGNKCNLACRMCTPQFTKHLIKEHREFEQRPDKFHLEEELNWYESDEFWEGLTSKAESLDRINLAGGEPLLVKRGLVFLQKLIDLDYAKNITLTYMTNLTILPREIYDIWPKFKAVEISASIDGFGEVNNYIRHPSKWEIVEKNYHKLQSQASKLNIKAFSIGTVVQCYNVFSLEKLYRFNFLYNKVGSRTIFPVLVHGTEFLDINILPKEIKIVAEQRLNRIIQTFESREEKARVLIATGIQSEEYDRNLDVIKGQVEGLINHLNSSEDLSEKRNQFINYTNFMDLSRKQSVCEVVPELAPLFFK